MSHYMLDSRIASEMSSLTIGEDEDYDDGSNEWGDGTGIDKCNLIINYLPHEIDDASLKALFAEHGEIFTAKVVKDKISKKSLGYGFVKYLKYEDAFDAIQKKNGLILGHKRIKVSIARPACEDIRNCKLYITNLPKEYTEHEVIDLFSQFGDIIECRVLKDRNAKSNRGVSFVQFNVKAQAHDALALNGFRPVGSDRCLVVKYAEDQHKKKDRMGGRMGGEGGMGMHDMDDSKSISSVDAYYYAQRGLTPNMGMTAPMQLQMMPGVHPMGGYMATQLVYGGAGAGSFTPSSSQRGGHNSKQGGVSGGGGLMLPSVSGAIGGDQWYNPHVGQIAYESRGGSAVIQSHQMGVGGHQMSHQMGHQMSSQDAYASSVAYDQNTYDIMADGRGSGVGGAGYARTRVSAAAAAVPGPDSSQQSGTVTIVISNLPAQTNVALLHELLSPYGRILSAQIDIDPSSSAQQEGGGDEDSAEAAAKSAASTGIGRAQIAGLAQAQYAQQALSGAILFEGGLPLVVDINAGGATSASGMA